MTEKEHELIDIYRGDIITAWKDDETLFISFSWVTLSFPLDETDYILEELHAVIASWLDKDNLEKEIIEKDDKIFGWEDQVEKILQEKSDDEQLPQEKIDLFSKFLMESNSPPSEKWQDFLNCTFTGIITNENIVSSLICAFRIGQTYQKHQVELEEGL